MWKSSAPVVAGVDGSDAAINAANWAIDEAISRDVPHRIVHVTHIETDVLWGSPDTAQVNESPNASLVCVGSIGIGALAAKIWRSTADLAEKAYCPVAIIRSPHSAPASGLTGSPSLWRITLTTNQ